MGPCFSVFIADLLHSYYLLKIHDKDIRPRSVDIVLVSLFLTQGICPLSVVLCYVRVIYI